MSSPPFFYSGTRMSVNSFLGDFPSSQGLSFVVVLLWVATGAVMLSGNKPADGWLGALEAMTFASVLHFGVKRFSYKPDGTQTVDTNPPETPPIG